jgi:hypothetical protein
MLKKLLPIIAIALTTTPINAQGISKQVLERSIYADPTCGEGIDTCYAAKAIVRVNDASTKLNVWSVHPERVKKGGSIVDSLRDGDSFFTNWVFTYKGRKMVWGYYKDRLCPDALTIPSQCIKEGSVDLRYLR